MNKLKLALKSFFQSLGEDIKNLFKHHLWRVFGFLIMFIVPIATLLTTYVSKTDGVTKWSIPLFVIVPLVLLILIYWGKLRRYFAIKVSTMKAENNIEKGKHAGAIIVCEFLQVVMTVLPFLVCYLLIAALEKEIERVSDIILFMIVCESVGGLFLVFDTIRNVIDYSEEELKELEDEIKEKK